MKTIFKMLISIILLLLVVFVILQKSDIPLEELKGKYCNVASKFIEMDGMNVHYKIEGEGNPIVLIHGTGSVLQTWDEWTDSLVRHNYKVIRLDMPGFGITGPRKDNDYSIKMYVKQRFHSAHKTKNARVKTHAKLVSLAADYKY